MHWAERHIKSHGNIELEDISDIRQKTSHDSNADVSAGTTQTGDDAGKVVCQVVDGMGRLAARCWVVS